MIKLRDIDKFVDSKYQRTFILKGIDLDIEQGEFVTIMGPSGAGKSTLINILSGVYKKDKGEIILRNKEIISEFIQFECKPKLIANNLLTLLNDKNYAKKQILEVKKTMPLLKDNNNLPSINAANEILKI